MDNLENNEEAEKYLELAKQAYDEENYEEAFNLFEKAAEQDITYAQRTIAWMYYYGEGVNQDFAKTEEWYDKCPLSIWKEESPEFRLLSSIFGESKYNIEFQDIINNNSEASYRIGEMFHYGDYIKQDFSKAFEWFENAAKQGNDKAQKMIDILYKNRKQDSFKTSDPIKRDESLSVHNEFMNKDVSNEAKYMEVCKENAIALCRFGFMYYSIEKDYSKAFKFFEKAAEYGNAYAQRMLAWMYYYGEGVNQNLVKAKEWYDKFPLENLDFHHLSFEDIVVTKDTKAQYAVGMMFYYGNYVKKDFLKALEWFEKAAKQGNTDAQNMLGILHENGNGVKQDFLKARDWYLRAAINDNVFAQYNLGYMYYSGNEIETNYEEAFKWFEKSACHNYQYAQNMLGTLYKEGKGVAQDYLKAKEWYEKAGYFELAQYNLSLMYFYGTGVQRDYQKAYELCRCAATKDRWGNIYIKAQKFLPNIKNYRTPLMEAAFSNSVSDAEELIKNKIDIDERNMMNRTALMFAADNNSLDVAKLLIKSGADVNAHAHPEAGREFNGKTALIYAACNDSFDVAKLLIESGADVNVATNSIFHRTAFWFATINNSVKVAKLLIESGADIYYDIDEIIKTNSIDIVKLLITTRKWMPSFSTDCIGKDSLDMIKLLNNSGFTSKNKSILLFAAKKNYVDIVKYLIDLGVDVNTTTTYQTTLLMEAAINNAVDVAKFLINAGADLNAKNSANKTALKLAADNNSVKIVKMLIDAGAAINTTFQNSTEQSQLSHPPKIEFYVQGVLVSKTVFNDMLLNRKQAKRTWFYIDGSKKEEIWNAFRFTEYSDLMANIKSSATYRKWKEKGIIKVEYNID